MIVDYCLDKCGHNILLSSNKEKTLEDHKHFLKEKYTFMHNNIQVLN